MKYNVIVDSGCDLAPEMFLVGKEVATAPLVMTLGDKNYLDDENLDIPGFVADMNRYEGRALSACPSPEAYMALVEEDAQNLVVTLSSELSGSYQAARVAADMAKDRGVSVHVFDSRSASAGETLVAIKLRELISEGLSMEAIVKAGEEFVRGMKTFFVLENLDNLVKNGRMSKIVGKLTTILHIRPILGADPDGNIAFYAKARGTVAAIDHMMKMVGEHLKDAETRTLSISHCENERMALRVKETAERLYNFKRIVVQKTRGLSSMYANRGGVVIAF